MFRKALAPVFVLAIVTLAACGSDDDSALPSTTSSPASSAPSTSNSSSTSSTGASSGSPASLPSGCTAPTADVEYTSGTATVEIPSGPNAGKLDLKVQPDDRNEYDTSSRDLKGEWKDAAGKALYVNVSGGDPCKPEPSAFVRIEPQGPSGPAFVDSGRNRCKVQLKAFSAQGVDGTFTCTQLGGGGEGVFIDATGTFSLRA